MVKFGKAITLETLDGFHPIKFIVIECETKEAADTEMELWLKDYPDLFKVNMKATAPEDIVKLEKAVANNVKILRMALNGK